MIDAAADIAARTAWGEARGEGADGMHAVLSVIGNRVASPGWWGHSISTVCLAHLQFSCWNSGDPNRDLLIHVNTSDPQFRIATALAQQLVAGTLIDTTRSSDSYYAIGSTPPKWAAKRPYQIIIGNHMFFRVGLAGDGQ